MTAIRWTDQAVADLEAIRDCVARDSAKYATLLVERLIASLDRVSHFPEIGRVVPEYQRPDIREIIASSGSNWAKMPSRMKRPSCAFVICWSGIS